MRIHYYYQSILNSTPPSFVSKRMCLLVYSHFLDKKERKKAVMRDDSNPPPPIANQVTVFLTVYAHKERDGFLFFLSEKYFPVPIERIPHISPQCEFLGRKNQLENGETEIDKSIRNVRMSFNYLTCPRAALQLCERRRTGCAADRW